MTIAPRFIFHANAAAIGGRIVKPKDIVIESSAASSLTVAGGRSRSAVKAGNFSDLVRFGAASTLAEGLFDDAKKWSDTLCGDDPSEDGLTASMRVSAEIRDLAISSKTPVSAKRVSGGFMAKSARGGGEPSIALGDDTTVDSLTLGKSRLIVEINTKLFQQYDTFAKLRTAADDPKFVRDNGDHLFMNVDVPGRTAASPDGRLVETGGHVYGTIVKSIKWADKPLPGAQIDGHVITIPDCLQIYVGEILIGALARRLTMLRIRLCCPFSGVICCCDTEDNGTWGF
jgi:hypothetical protein